jgi:polyphosphate kinase 2 (PPK2 family)
MVSKVLTFSKWLKEAKKQKLLSREGISGYQVEKCTSEFFLLKNQENKPVCVLETGRTCLKSNIKNSILEGLPDHSIKFPCYTVSMQSPSNHESNATTLFKVNKIMPRRSAVGIFTNDKFVRWIVGKVYSPKGAKQ